MAATAIRDATRSVSTGENSGFRRATSAEAGDNVSELDALVEGEPLEIAFNVRYLIEAVSVIDTPQAVLETTRPDRPGLFRPVGAGPEEFVHVIMPMQFNR